MQFIFINELLEKNQLYEISYIYPITDCQNRKKDINLLKTCINDIPVNQTTDADYCKAVEMVLDCLAETKCQEVADFYKFINRMEIQQGVNKCFNDSKLHSKLLISISDISREYYLYQLSYIINKFLLSSTRL